MGKCRTYTGHTNHGDDDPKVFIITFIDNVVLSTVTHPTRKKNSGTARCLWGTFLISDKLPFFALTSAKIAPRRHRATPEERYFYLLKKMVQKYYLITAGNRRPLPFRPFSSDIFIIFYFQKIGQIVGLRFQMVESLLRDN